LAISSTNSRPDASTGEERVVSDSSPKYCSFEFSTSAIGVSNAFADFPAVYFANISADDKTNNSADNIANISAIYFFQTNDAVANIAAHYATF
jgi:hypothetical protein